MSGIVILRRLLFFLWSFMLTFSGVLEQLWTLYFVWVKPTKVLTPRSPETTYRYTYICTPPSLSSSQLDATVAEENLCTYLSKKETGKRKGRKNKQQKRYRLTMSRFYRKRIILPVTWIKNGARYHIVSYICFRLLSIFFRFLQARRSLRRPVYDGIFLPG